ncbi:hypothetical protein [Lacticaseibacillus brantae]|uniref:Uncharacterized protein n=1 Tax=Lacticaseibacillus brantae DSM 23927 TaxID=1423727 RepID=A0A0R2AXP6_9LACO|nr:hypothetical protein [Lacticaseibacillus brantae]KRM72168.1 hypothetical protein FC34_GL001152 [Lacticaseibacillus brantae DSM 23927]
MKNRKFKLAIAAGLLLAILSGCAGKSNSAKASHSSSERSSQVSKASSSSSSESSDSSSTSSSSTSESSVSASSSSQAVTITTPDQAVAAVKAAETSEWTAKVNGPLVFGYVNMVTVKGQQAFRVDIGANNGRSTVASYGVLPNGNVVLIQAY